MNEELARVTAPGIEIVRRDDWLAVHFAVPQRTASWALAGGGLHRAQAVVWLEVRNEDLRPPVDAQELLARRLRALGHPQAVGFLTSRNLDAFVAARRSAQDIDAHCVATVGLGNALRAGDPPGPAGRIGTINVLCHVGVPLGTEALLEALALAAEARTLAVRECRIPSNTSGAPASGTGTDCIAIAAPDTGRGLPYAGKHTAAGHLIGAVVEDAVRRGAAAWLRERGLA